MLGWRQVAAGAMLGAAGVVSAMAAMAPEAPQGRWNVTVHYLGQVSAARLDFGQSAAVAHAGRFALTDQGGGVLKTCLREFAGEAQCTDIRLQRKGTAFSGRAELAGAALAVEGRQAAVRPGPAVHVFEPQVFQQHYWSGAAPQLRIFPGDTVRTTTLDSEGVDEHGKRRSLFINPQTGPFYVEGAMPGDTLVVRFNSIRMNRDSADMFSSSVVPQALQPDYVRNAGAVPRLDSAWKLDTTRGVARLANPTSRLRDFVVDLQPMLGCVGVAPPDGEAIVGYDLGVFGGNLDYPRIVSGATVYLPVFAPGALLFIGDAHARQGHAELTGTGLETSAAVEFTVELIEGKSLGQVRVEDDKDVMIMGVGGSLSEALQSSTTGMTRWLAGTYGLNDAESALVLGSAIEYDIAEIVDPHINVVARLQKKALERLALR